ncbi:hypothetical protein Pyn_13469 [Prunus yedoensis var. nudiflora]|uniref:Thionin-like protein 2 n=1 Tax=Prunus yedoensis var. nudiflora TaxID=2094558 RepID=A0A314UGJ9_PRUYE|nr:hypothetical protein Pyn_13469 [Prunus yedoensis var. nudiflora]
MSTVKKMAVALLVLCAVFSCMEKVVDSAGVDCYDACNTGCVQSNTRLYLRCDRKCQIRCGPDSEVEGNLE